MLVVMPVGIEKVSAITLEVTDMQRSVWFYQGVLGLELLFGGPQSGFSSLRVPESSSPIINLQQGEPVGGWGRIIFHVSDVDAFWNILKRNGFNPNPPQDAAWGERYFHLYDPDGHELSFARPA